MDNFIYVLLRSELSETNLFRVEMAISVKTSIQYVAAMKKANCTQGSFGKELKIKLQHCNVLMKNYNMFASGVLYIVLLHLAEVVMELEKVKKREIFRGLDTFLIRKHLSFHSLIPKLCSVAAQGEIFVMSFCSIITL